VTSGGGPGRALGQQRGSGCSVRGRLSQSLTGVSPGPGRAPFGINIRRPGARDDSVSDRIGDDRTFMFFRNRPRLSLRVRHRWTPSTLRGSSRWPTPLMTEPATAQSPTQVDTVHPPRLAPPGRWPTLLAGVTVWTKQPS
jgi:hypothetical protein